MKISELAKKLNKSVDEIKRVLQEMNVPFKNATSPLEDSIITKITEKFNPPKAKKMAVKVIKKAALSTLENADTEKELTASEKASKLTIQENQKKKEPEPPKEEIKPAEEAQNAISSLNPENYKKKSDDKTGSAAPDTPLKPNIHLKK